MTDKIQVGDRVRVSREFTVRRVDGGYLFADEFSGSYSTRLHDVEVIETRRPKVGDEIEVDRISKMHLPVGTVVQGTASGIWHFKTCEGWAADSKGAISLPMTGGTYRIEFIPGNARP